MAGLPDDCWELRTLRRFRDTWMAEKEKTLNLIPMYYKIAPLILDELEKDTKKSAILCGLYLRYIVPSCIFIELGFPRMALSTYRKMVRRLCQRYSVNLDALKTLPLV